MRRFIVLLILTGCATAHKAPQPPPMPPAATLKPLAAPEAETLPPPGVTVTLTLSNAPTCQGRHMSGIVGTTNLVNWYRLAFANYQSGLFTVTLSNRPLAEFYRAFNN